MAREAGLHLYVNDLTEEPYALVVERFANLVAAAEREEIAKLADSMNTFGLPPDVGAAIIFY